MSPCGPVLVTEQLLVNGRILPGLPTIPRPRPTQFGLIAAVAGFSVITGGIAGDAGALRSSCHPAAPLTPIIAISAMFTDSLRILAADLPPPACRRR